MPRFHTVLFDLDGTLLDSIRLILDGYHHTSQVHGLPRQSDAEWLRGVGTPLRAQLAPWARDEAMLEAMIATYRVHFHEHHDTSVRAYPGAVAAVQTLATAGINLGVVTSKNRVGTLRGLKAAGLEGIIETLVCADDVVNAKPDREPVDRAVALLRADPATTVFVGDSVHDMRAGAAAGVRTAAALWGPFTRTDLAKTNPDHWLPSPAAIVALVV